MTQTAFWSATELIKAIRKKQVTATGLLDLYMARLEKFNSDINAVVVTDYDRAAKRAAEADKALAQGDLWGPLHGLPMTVKDNLEFEGLVCTAGAPELKDHVRKRIADVVQSIVDAGAIVFGKTNLPLYGDDMQSYNKVYGQTNNPWDVSRTPGGSSGGAAAALAAGLTGLDIGNDIGGSIRHPANFCGIYGHKSTYGIVPSRGLIPPPPGLFTGDHTIRADIAVNGPMGRSADDLDLMMRILAQPELPEQRAWQIHLPPPRKRNLTAYRIGLWLDDTACPVDAQVGSCLQAAADALAKAGAGIADQKPDIEMAESHRVFVSLLNGTLGMGAPPDLFAKWIDREPGLREDAEDYKTHQIRGAIQRHRDWLMTDAQRQALRQKWADFFTTFDALLCPVTPVAAFPHDHGPWFKRTLLINGREAPYAEVLGWAGLTNVVFLPSTVAPVGFTQSGLPVGIQIVAPYLEDRTSIHIAKLMADVVGGFKPPKGFE